MHVSHAIGNRHRRWRWDRLTPTDHHGVRAGAEVEVDTRASNNNQHETISFLLLLRWPYWFHRCKKAASRTHFLRRCGGPSRRYHTHAAIDRTPARREAMFLISFQKRLCALRQPQKRGDRDRSR